VNIDASLQKALQERRAADLYRQRRLVGSAQQPLLHVEGKPLLAFCSNDYLGLANHPKVKQAFVRATESYGVGSGASHLVNGHSLEHHALEEELAAFTGRERALLFSTGYMANLGTVNALLGRSDAVFEDRLNHASLLDAGLLSGAQFQRFPHNDCEQLHKRLAKSEAARKLIVVDGVFSMDGDTAPLPELAALADRHQAWLMVDDAHGFGCLGAQGGGCAEHFGLSADQLPILVGTLGKAFGTFGAFVAGSEALIETLIQFARTYIYTTALPPAVAAATRASLQLLQEEGWRREHLQALVQQFRAGAAERGLTLMDSISPIQPIMLGSEKAALAVCQALEARGFWVPAIRPPTVPVGTARLRVTLSAEHTAEHVESLLNALSDAIADRRNVQPPHAEGEL
jgi:8-amino-7-oxononanoate synthase